MSPEMAAGRWSDVSTASDIYGLGAILYTMLTGRAPFRGGDARETLSLVVSGKLTSPVNSTAKVDRELNAVCLKCLDRRADQALRFGRTRWRTTCVDGSSVRPTLAGGKPSAARELRFWVRRHPRGLSPGGHRGRSALAGRSRGLVGRAARGERARAARLAEPGRSRAASDPPSDADPGKRPEAPRGLVRFRTSGSGRAAAEPRSRHTSRPRSSAKTCSGSPAETRSSTSSSSGPTASCWPTRCLRAPPSASTTASAITTGPSSRTIWPREYVYVARSFRSVKDARYKIAVSTRVWGDRGELLGILVANFTIGPRLIDVDYRQEPNVAAVLCPMDRSDPTSRREDTSHNLAVHSVLDRRYTADWKDQAVQAEPVASADFQKDARACYAAEGWEGASSSITTGSARRTWSS